MEQDGRVIDDRSRFDAGFLVLEVPAANVQGRVGAVVERRPLQELVR